MKCTVISDTHCHHKDLDFTHVDEDTEMIIHCGDFSNNQREVFQFCKWYGELDFKYKILIAGNHDMYIERVGKEPFKEFCEEKGIIYLEDESVEIEGIKFHGSPWSNKFHDWAFMKEEEDLQKYWDMIPLDTQVLLTHCPAKNIGDSLDGYQDTAETNVGSVTLAGTLPKLKKLTHHFFGHIHEDYGEHKQESYLAFNASSYDYYKRRNKKPYSFII